MIQLKKTILTLVALLAVTTGAWAAEETVTWEGSTLESIDVNSYGTTKTQTIGDITITANSGYFQTTTDSWTQSKATTASAFEANGLVFSSEKNIKSVEVHASDDSTFGGACIGGVTSHTYTLTPAATSFAFPYGDGWLNITKIVFTLEEAASAASSGPEVAWNKTAKTGKFTMPGGNVTLEPEYYPQAALTTAPTAINDVPATTDGAIVNAGTVKNIGSTETAQGTVMYYVSPTALDDAALLALAADQWTADVPTAQSLAQGQAYVYYYVRGNDSDNDDENFSDGDILAANALTVTIAAEPTYAVTFADGVNPEPPAEPEWTASPAADVKKGQTVTVTYTGTKKVIGVKAEKYVLRTLAEATAEDYGKVVCAAGHLHDAKTAVPTGCTAVGILGKVTETGHGLILSLKNANSQNWNTINGWTSASYAGTTLKVLPDAGARGNLSSYETLGETTVSNWAVAHKSDYEAIFENLGSTTGNDKGKTYDGNVNAYITDAGGTAVSGYCWSATEYEGNYAWYFRSGKWSNENKVQSYMVRPVLGF